MTRVIGIASIDGVNRLTEVELRVDERDLQGAADNIYATGGNLLL